MQPTPTAASDWTRDDWTAFADRLLAGVMAHASAGRGRITPPGAEGGYGRDVDGLEGFARTFLLAGFRIAGERGVGVDHLIDFFAEGIRTGVDPDAADRWVRMEEHAQAKVEAASLALILDLTREWIWDRLDARTQDRVIGYLAPVVGDHTYPKTNWLWFRIVVQTFLRSVGGPWSVADIAADLALHDSLVREDGWIADGAERAYDHYVGWALHLYPILWSRMQGAADLVAELSPGRTERDIAGLDRYLQDAIALIGGDGSPLIQGRSLVYRFAAAAPLWAGVIAEVPSLSAGALRHAAARVVSHFDHHGAPDDQDLLTLGWHGEWRRLAQSYSGPASPYWAAKGLLGLALPADHPVWAAPAEPLPIDRGDFTRAIAAPGWIVTGSAADGIVRVVNHGTDKALAGSLSGDSPLYARLGYSTATSPLLDDRAWIDPLEQSVALIDLDDRATHRSALEPLGARVLDDGTGWAASTWLAHTLVPAPTPGHGQGLRGEVEVLARITTHSVVRGPWEARIVRVDPVDESHDLDELTLRIGGWPVAGERPFAQNVEHAARVAAGELTSIIRVIGDDTVEPLVAQRLDASPLGTFAAVPVVEVDVDPGTWHTAFVELARTGEARSDLGLPTISVADRGEGVRIDVTWPDRVETSASVPLTRIP